MKRVEEIKGKRQAHFMAARQKAARAQERAKDRKEVARDMALIKSPAAGLKRAAAAEEEMDNDDLEMDTNIDTRVAAKAKKAKKDVVKIIEEPEADQEMVTL